MSDKLEALRNFDDGVTPTKWAARRITALEAGIIEALRNPDEDMRPILRKALHGDNQT